MTEPLQNTTADWIAKLDQLAAKQQWMAPLYVEMELCDQRWTVLAIVCNKEYQFRDAVRATAAGAKLETARLIFRMLKMDHDAPNIGIPRPPAVTAIVMAHRAIGGQMTPTLSSCMERQYCVCDERGFAEKSLQSTKWIPTGQSPQGTLVWMQITEEDAMPMAQRALLGILWLVRNGHRTIAIHCDPEDVLPINLALNALGLRFAPATDRASAAVLRVSF